MILKICLFFFKINLAKQDWAKIGVLGLFFLPEMPHQVLLCGGGSRNLCLKQRLQFLLPSIPVLTTDEVGLNADFKEAIAFAVLAYWRQLNLPGNLPAATGASREVLLGEVYPAD